MKKNLLILILMLFTLTGCINFEQPKENIVQTVIKYEDITVKDFNQMLEVAIEIASESSVAIVASSSGFFPHSSLGSGVIISKKSNTYYVLTNRHVIENKGQILSNINVYFSSDENNYIVGKVEYYDNKIDIAVISFTSNYTFNTAKLSEVDNIKKGSFVFAYGSPYDLEFFGTANFGIISAKRREIEDEVFNGVGTSINSYIQHDAPINNGNSGGGLFDIYGNLIGINTLKLTGDGSDKIDGIGFAIPIDVLTSHTNIKSYFA